jgi:predicted esterase
MDQFPFADTKLGGVEMAQAQAGMIFLHGRGGDAASILRLADRLDTSGFTLLAPQAPGNAWYPERFLAPLERNEPWLSQALDKVSASLNRLKQSGIPPEKTVLLGFSQGACLALEFAARNARRYGGLVGLSGSLIGPENLVRNDLGSLEGTPVFLGCSDEDIHIPRRRVEQSAAALEKLGGTVTLRLYSNMDHTVNADELNHVQEMMNAVTLRR